MSPELNWCGQPIGEGEGYGGRPENIPKNWGKKPALAAAKQHQHYAVITEEDLAEVFGHGAYTLTLAEAAKLLEELTGAHRTSCYRVLASADALLSVMSFEKEHELFMRTSFTTKFLDYVAFGKPVILWGPEYCTPVSVAREHGGAAVVTTDDPGAVVSLCGEIAADSALNDELSKQVLHLHQTFFSPDRLQAIFVDEIEKLVATGAHQ
jgi:hypothetical protein